MEHIGKKIKLWFASVTMRHVLLIVAALAMALFVFIVGEIVGYKKAAFSYRWGENYHRNFGGPRGGFFQHMIGDDFVNPHGAYGRIVNIELPNLTIAGDDGEKIITLSDATIIRQFKETVSSSSLKIGDGIIVVGTPNASSTIAARFIRMFPN